MQIFVSSMYLMGYRAGELHSHWCASASSRVDPEPRLFPDEPLEVRRELAEFGAQTSEPPLGGTHYQLVAPAFNHDFDVDTVESERPSGFGPP